MQYNKKDPIFYLAVQFGLIFSILAALVFLISTGYRFYSVLIFGVSFLTFSVAGALVGWWQERDSGEDD